MTSDKTPARVTTGIGGWSEGANLIGSVLAGWLLGFGLDYWLNTSPWFTVIGILLGSYSGFMRMWAYAKRQAETDHES